MRRRGTTLVRGVVVRFDVVRVGGVRVDVVQGDVVRGVARVVVRGLASGVL